MKIDTAFGCDFSLLKLVGILCHHVYRDSHGRKPAAQSAEELDAWRSGNEVCDHFNYRFGLQGTAGCWPLTISHSSSPAGSTASFLPTAV